MYMVLAVISTCIFSDLDPAKSFPLRLAAKAITQQLGKLVEANIKTVNATGWIAGIADSMHQHHSPLTDYGVHMVRRLLESGMGVSDITWSQIVPTAGAMVANQAQAVRSVLKNCHPILFNSRLVYPTTRLLPIRRRQETPPRNQQMGQNRRWRSRRQAPALRNGRHQAQRDIRLLPPVLGINDHR